MRWWLYLRLFTPLLPLGLYGKRLLGRKNLVINSLCTIGLLLAIQFIYLMMMLLSLTIPQVMFSSMDAVDLLEAAIGDTPPLLSSSSQVVPLQLSSSSSDALPSSSVITFNIADHDPPTEDEQPKKERRAAHENGSSQSQNSLGTMEGKARRRTRRRRTGQSSFTNSTLSTDVTSGNSTMDTALTTEKSTDHLCSTDCPHSSDFGCHTSSFTIDHESVQSSIRLLLDHRLSKARQRTNVVTPDYVPRGRLFGGYTTRGEGVTIASYRFPQVVSAIHDIASTRPPGFTDEPYLSAQVNASTSLPVHKDKNNHSFYLVDCLWQL